MSERNLPATPADPSPLLAEGSFASMWRLAEAMAKAKTISKDFQNSPGDCLRAVELAHRTGQSPFAIIDHLFNVGGKLAYDGQGMAAMINAHPKIVGSLRYVYSGDGDRRECRVVGRLAGETEDRDVVVTLKQGLADSKGARARWQSDPDQMLAYYGARKWGRRHAPEVTMGLFTPDELRAGAEGGSHMRDITPAPEAHDEDGVVIEEQPFAKAPRDNYTIPLNGGGWQRWQGVMAKAIDKADSLAKLDKLEADNRENLAQLREEVPNAVDALSAKFYARREQLQDEDQRELA